MAETRPRGLGPSDLLTADELGKYLHRRREAAVAFAERHGIGLSCDEGPTLYPVAEVLTALRTDAVRKTNPKVAMPDLSVPLPLAPVNGYRGGPRRGPRA